MESNSSKPDCDKVRRFIENELTDPFVKESLLKTLRQLEADRARSVRRIQTRAHTFRIKLPSGEYYTLEGLDYDVTGDEICGLLAAELPDQFSSKFNLYFPNGQGVPSTNFHFTQGHVNMEDHCIHLVCSGASSLPSKTMPVENETNRSPLMDILSSSSQSIPLSNSFDYFCISVHLNFISNGHVPIQISQARPGFASATRVLPSGHIIDLKSWSNHAHNHRLLNYQGGFVVEVKQDDDAYIITINQDKRVVVPVIGGEYSNLNSFLLDHPLQMRPLSIDNDDDDLLIGPNHNLFQPPRGMLIRPQSDLMPPMRPGRGRLFGSEPDPDHHRPPFI